MYIEDRGQRAAGMPVAIACYVYGCFALMSIARVYCPIVHQFLNHQSVELWCSEVQYTYLEEPYKSALALISSLVFENQDSQ